MTKRRPPDFDLVSALDKAGFTARDRDVAELFGLLASPNPAHAAAAERALVDLATRLGPAFVTVFDAYFSPAGPPLRGRLARLLGRLALAERPLLPRVLALVDDPEPKTSRNAVIALGRLPSVEAERRLIALLSAPQSPGHLRSAASTLGKIGGAAALAALRELAAGDDAELARLRSQALLRLERTLGRDAASHIDLDAVPERPVAVELSCRAGLEGLLAEELAARARSFAPRAVGPGRVEATLDRSLADLFRARLFIGLGFPLPGQPAQRAKTAEAAVRAVTSPAALALLRRFTRGPIRYRLSFASGGHRRAEVLRIATAIGAAAPELVNDPTATTWDVEIGERRGGIDVRLVPRRLADPRFSYRRRDVPAASHPTVAAALARVAGVRADDVVWDPFVGSGGELVERALLGPYRALHGCDTDAEALAAAAENLASAGHRATLEGRDALLGVPPGTTLIITNPPMGQRVLSRDKIAPLLARVVDMAAAALPRGGRLTWLSPLPEETAERAARGGLTVARRIPVDLGGILTELQLFVK